VNRIPPSEMIGKVFGRLTVLRFDRVKRVGTRRDSYYVCRCECGKTCSVACVLLRSGGTRSCGCLQREMRFIINRKHGHKPFRGKPTKEYVAWQSMKARCYRPKNRCFKDYGGRGIEVCDRWLRSFQTFLDDIGIAPSRELSIDRIDVDGNYEPGNVRWATPSQQRRNRRDRVLAQ